MNPNDVITVPIEKTTGVKCENCQGEIFTHGLMLREASRFITMTAKDGIMPIPVFVCAKCGNVNKKFLPKELQNENS